MAKTYADLLQEVKGQIKQVTLEDLNARIEGGEELTLVDVREKDEWRQGYIPGAVHVPRGFLEMQAASKLPKKDAKLVVYCAGGIRSAFAAKALQDLGYEHVESANPGYGQWKDKGFPITAPFAFTDDQLDRYSRHLLLPEVGEKGQQKLLEGRVLLLGAGGLGSPAALYLAAAGVGTIGIIDGDHVDASNLQRQVLHGLDRVGQPKVESGAKTIANLNPDVNVIPFNERLDSSNVDRIFDQGWDVIVDGLDNFPTRYLVNDASIFKGIPVVHGSIFRFDGQVTTFMAGEGPLLPLPLPRAPAGAPGAELRGGRRPRSPARHHRHHPGDRGRQDHPRPGQAPQRPPAPPTTASKMAFRTLQAPPGQDLPRLRRQPEHHRVHRLRRLLLGLSEAVGKLKTPLRILGGVFNWRRQRRGEVRRRIRFSTPQARCTQLARSRAHPRPRRARPLPIAPDHVISATLTRTQRPPHVLLAHHAPGRAQRARLPPPHPVFPEWRAGVWVARASEGPVFERNGVERRKREAP